MILIFCQYERDDQNLILLRLGSRGKFDRGMVKTTNMQSKYNLALALSLVFFKY